MSVVINEAKRRLEAGELAIGFGLRQSRTMDTPQIAKACGYDWIFIDMEHAPYDVDLAAQMSQTALSVGVTPIVRVPGPQHFHASRLLDAGALGIVVPHVDTAEQAAQAVSYCRYPPLGKRSLAGSPPQTRFAPMSTADAAAAVNKEGLVVVMVESPLAVENADAMAAVKGVDVLLIGSNDLAAEMGITGQVGHAKIKDAYAKVTAACKKHGKYAGMGGVYEPDLMKEYIGMGAQFLLGGSDFSFLMAGAKQRASALRSFQSSK
jgi:2-keto-3-deoxy-L-rhamnonate aldolase RhmA